MGSIVTPSSASVASVPVERPGSRGRIAAAAGVEAEPDPRLGSLDRGSLEHLPFDVLARAPAAKLFERVVTIDENPHLLHGLHELVAHGLTKLAPPDEVRSLGQRLANEGPAPVARALRGSARDHCRKRSEELRRWVTTSGRTPALAREALRAVLARYVPAGLTEGRLLQYATNATLTHLPLGARLLRLQSFEMGGGDLREHPAHNLRLLSTSLEIGGLDVPGSFGGPEIGELAFEKAIFGWSLSLFPRIRLPELLGFVLAQYSARVPPLVAAMREHLELLGGATSQGQRYFAIDPIDADTTPRLDLAIAIVETLLATATAEARPAVTERLASGILAHQTLAERWDRHAWAALSSREVAGRVRTAAKVAQIMESRLEAAKGSHTHVRMGGGRLEDMLSSESKPFDATAFLEALAASRFVVRGSSTRSPLLRAMTALDGPMFRVFTPEEIATIAAWIDDLPGGGETREETRQRAAGALSRPFWQAEEQVAEAPAAPLESCPWWSASRSADATSAADATIERYASLAPRTVIRHLLDIEAFPEVRVFARHFIDSALAKARFLLDPATSARIVLPPGDPLPREFFHLRRYSPEGLEAHLASQAALQRASYDAWHAERHHASREKLRSDMSGGMPAGLIDGAWLQYVAASELFHDITTCRLYKIYEDELGNGDLREHHGNILRRLLGELDVAVPDIVTSSFEDTGAYAPGNCAIALLWLGISLFPTHYKAELLGLNLGIESWGVGGAFRISEATLRHHRLDPLLPRLHNAIDNYFEGHTGWAKAAVHRHLAQAAQAGGDALRQQTWERIWAGYALWAVRHQLSLDLSGESPIAAPRTIALMPS